MNKETALLILRRFVDYSRENLSNPFSQELPIGKYLCGTDGKTIVLIPETEENKIDNVGGILPPDVGRILKDFSTPVTLDFNTLKSIYDSIPIIERKKTHECDSCDGEGQFYHYKHWYDCKKCNETGEIESNETEKVKEPNTSLLFNECIISTEKIDGIFYIRKFLTEPIEFKVLYSDPSITWFQLNDIIIGIAALNQLNDEVKECKKIKVI